MFEHVRTVRAQFEKVRTCLNTARKILSNFEHLKKLQVSPLVKMETLSLRRLPKFLTVLASTFLVQLITTNILHRGTRNISEKYLFFLAAEGEAAGGKEKKYFSIQQT